MKQNGTATTNAFDPASYLFGRYQQFTEVYASGNGLSADNLAAGVAALFHASTSGQVLGDSHPVSSVRGEAAERHEAVKPAPKVGKRSYVHGTRRASKFLKRKIKKSSGKGKGPSKYWASKSAEERRLEMARRMQVRREKAAAAA